MPQAHYGPIRVSEGPSDERFRYLSDILATAWQDVKYADIQRGSSVAVYGLGPVGQFCTRIAKQLDVEQVFGIDRLNTLINSVYGVRRGGTVSLSGVYGGAVGPLPIVDIFDRNITLRVGQCNVKHWIDDIVPYLTGDGDPLGAEDMATHHMSLDEVWPAWC